MSTIKKLKYVLPMCLLILTTSIPSTYSTTTGPNTFFMAWKYEGPNGEGDGLYQYRYEVWAFAIRDQDQPTGRASLSDFEISFNSCTKHL